MNPFTEEFVALILLCSGIAVPIIELIKKMFTWAGKFAVILSLVIAAIVSVPLGLANNLGGILLGVLVLMTWAVANGWYKVTHKSKKTE